MFHPNSDFTEPFGAIDTVRMGRYKVMWRSGGTFAACNGPKAEIVFHNPPLVFDVVNDPAEDQLLTPQTVPGLDMVSSLRRHKECSAVTYAGKSISVNTRIIYKNNIQYNWTAREKGKSN